MKPVVSREPWTHLQIDLIDFHEFADVNDNYRWLLTCVCTFSKYLVAVPMKNKEATTVAKQPDTTIHNDDNDVDNTLNRYRSKETYAN